MDDLRLSDGALANLNEGVAALDGLALLYENVLDSTGILGNDVVLHLHGFHDDEDITGIDALTHSGDDLDDVAGQGSVDGLGTGSGSSLGSSGSSRSSLGCSGSNLGSGSCSGSADNLDELVAAIDGLTDADENVLDGAVELGDYVVLHLHGFHGEEYLAGLDGLTSLDEHLGDVAGQGSLDGLLSASGRSSGGSSDDGTLGSGGLGSLALNLYGVCFTIDGNFYFVAFFLGYGGFVVLTAYLKLEIFHCLKCSEVINMSQDARRYARGDGW